MFFNLANKMDNSQLYSVQTLKSKVGWLKKKEHKYCSQKVEL